VLVVVDSAAAACVRARLDENSNADVTALWSCFAAMARSPWDAALVIIDHMAKAEEEGRYSRGASAKLASSDVMYRLDSLRPFTREEDGLARLAVTKDRDGCLPRHVRLRVHHGPPLAFAEEEVTDTAGDPGPMPPAQAKLFEALDEVPRTIAGLTDRIAGQHGHGLKRETASRGLTALARAGLAERHESGHGQPALWSRAGRDGPEPVPDQSRLSGEETGRLLDD